MHTFLWLALGILAIAAAPSELVALEERKSLLELRAALDDPDEAVQRNAAVGLMQFGDAADHYRVLGWLEVHDNLEAATTALASLNSPAVAGFLLDLAGRNSGYSGVPLWIVGQMGPVAQQEALARLDNPASPAWAASLIVLWYTNLQLPTDPERLAKFRGLVKSGLERPRAADRWAAAHVAGAWKLHDLLEQALDDREEVVRVKAAAFWLNPRLRREAPESATAEPKVTALAIHLLRSQSFVFQQPFRFPRYDVYDPCDLRETCEDWLTWRAPLSTLKTLVRLIASRETASNLVVCRDCKDLRMEVHRPSTFGERLPQRILNVVPHLVARHAADEAWPQLFRDLGDDDLAQGMLARAIAERFSAASKPEDLKALGRLLAIAHQQETPLVQLVLASWWARNGDADGWPRASAVLKKYLVSDSPRLASAARIAFVRLSEDRQRELAGNLDLRRQLLPRLASNMADLSGAAWCVLSRAPYEDGLLRALVASPAWSPRDVWMTPEEERVAIGLRTIAGDPATSAELRWRAFEALDGTWQQFASGSETKEWRAWLTAMGKHEDLKIRRRVKSFLEELPEQEPASDRQEAVPATAAHGDATSLRQRLAALAKTLASRGGSLKSFGNGTGEQILQDESILDDKQAEELLAIAWNDRNLRARWSAAECLGAAKPTAATNTALRRLVRHPLTRVRMCAAEALGERQDEESAIEWSAALANSCEAALANGRPPIEFAVADSRQGSSSDRKDFRVETFAILLKSPHGPLHAKQNAIRGLGCIGDSDAILALVEHGLLSPHNELEAAACKWLPFRATWTEDFRGRPQKDASMESQPPEALGKVAARLRAHYRARPSEIPAGAGLWLAACGEPADWDRLFEPRMPAWSEFQGREALRLALARLEQAPPAAEDRPMFSRFAKQTDPWLRLLGLKGLALSGDAAAARTVLRAESAEQEAQRLMLDPGASLRRDSIDFGDIRTCPSRLPATVAQRFLCDPDVAVRVGALRAVVADREPVPWDVKQRAIRDPDPFVRRAVAAMPELGAYGAQASVFLRDRDPVVRMLAQKLLSYRDYDIRTLLPPTPPAGLTADLRAALESDHDVYWQHAVALGLDWQLPVPADLLPKLAARRELRQDLADWILLAGDEGTVEYVLRTRCDLLQSPDCLTTSEMKAEYWDRCRQGLRRALVHTDEDVRCEAATVAGERFHEEFRPALLAMRAGDKCVRCRGAAAFALLRQEYVEGLPWSSGYMSAYSPSYPGLGGGGEGFFEIPPLNPLGEIEEEFSGGFTSFWREPSFRPRLDAFHVSDLRVIVSWLAEELVRPQSSLLRRDATTGLNQVLEAVRLAPSSMQMEAYGPWFTAAGAASPAQRVIAWFATPDPQVAVPWLKSAAGDPRTSPAERLAALQAWGWLGEAPDAVACAVLDTALDSLPEPALRSPLLLMAQLATSDTSDEYDVSSITQLQDSEAAVPPEASDPEMWIDPRVPFQRTKLIADLLSSLNALATPFDAVRRPVLSALVAPNPSLRISAARLLSRHKGLAPAERCLLETCLRDEHNPEVWVALLNAWDDAAR